jgi:hypothetical protein
MEDFKASRFSRKVLGIVEKDHSTSITLRFLPFQVIAT